MTPEQEMALLQARYWLLRAADPQVFKEIPNTHAFCYVAVRELEAAFPVMFIGPLKVSTTTMTKPDFPWEVNQEPEPKEILDDAYWAARAAEHQSGRAERQREYNRQYYQTKTIEKRRARKAE